MDEQNTKNNEIENKETTPQKQTSDIATIMPTMLDDNSDSVKVKRDISAIVPKFESIETQMGEELTSKDAELKSDGSEVIATIDDLGDATYKANFQMPLQIDIKERKELQSKEKTKKKKKEKTKPTKAAKQQQNIMSLAALVVIAGLVCFYFFVYKAPGEEDFTPLTVTIELGDPLPIRTREYVEPGIKGSNVDELQYAKDTSKVKLEEVGTYEFTITYKGITKTGNVIIQDTTEPELTTRNVIIAEGSTYSASSFVESCIDYSGCNYSFQDSETTKKYTSPGVYQIYIIATDAFNNPTTKKANLIIENKGEVKTYVRSTAFDFNTGYSLVEEYNLSFAAYDGYSLLTSGIHKRIYVYEDEEKYKAAAKEYNGEANYQCIDHERKIIYTKTVTMIGSNYSKLSDIENYFRNEGFKEQ